MNVSKKQTDAMWTRVIAERNAQLSKKNVMAIARQIASRVGRVEGNIVHPVKHVGRWRYTQENDSALIDFGILYALISLFEDGEVYYKARLPVRNWESDIDGSPGGLPLYGHPGQGYKTGQSPPILRRT